MSAANAEHQLMPTMVLFSGDVQHMVAVADVADVAAVAAVAAVADVAAVYDIDAMAAIAEFGDDMAVVFAEVATVPFVGLGVVLE